MLFVLFALTSLCSSLGLSVFGFDFGSSFFTNEFVTQQVFLGNITGKQMYLVDEQYPKLAFNTSSGDLYLPIMFPANIPADTMEIVLSVDLFPELLQICIWKDHKGVPISDLESSRVEVCKTCSDFFDECIQQMHMRYNKRPPHLADGYNFRMAARLDEVEGRWTIRISRKPLPHHAAISVHLSITTKDYEMSLIAFLGSLFFVALAVAILLIAAAVLTYLRRPVVVEASAAPATVSPSEGSPVRRSALRGFLQRVAGWFTHQQEEPYSQMPPEGAPAADPQHTATTPTAAPPATVASPAAPASDASSSTAVATSTTIPSPLMQQLLSRGLIKPPSASAPNAEEEEEENFCRICRCLEPEADLFRPCNCDGSMKFVHRACLAEWREKTTNPTNRQYCSECKAPFRIVVQDAAFHFVVDSLRQAGRLIIPVVGLEAGLLLAGYSFKGVAGVLQMDLQNVEWAPDWYHHLLGLQLLVVYVIHYRVLAAALEGSISNWGLASITVPTLLLEVFTGYFAHFLLWCFGSILWDWQVYYISGCIVVALYAFYLHDSLVAAYNRWALQHRSEVVLDRSQLVP